MGEIVNYSAKMDAEHRDHLQQLISESGKTAGEFISSMMACYEANQNRETLTEVRELNQLKNHLARIEEIYIGMAKSRKDEEESHRQTTGSLLEQLKEMKAALVDAQENAKEEIQTMTNYVNNLQEQTRADREEVQKELEELTAAKERAEEGQRAAQKVADMTEQVLQQLQAQVADLKEKAAASHSIAENATADLAGCKEQLTAALADVATFKMQLENERTAAERTISDLKQQAELDRERAVLAAQREAMEERKALQDEIVRLRDQLATERERIAKLEASQKNTGNPKNTTVK